MHTTPIRLRRWPAALLRRPRLLRLLPLLLVLLSACEGLSPSAFSAGSATSEACPEGGLGCSCGFQLTCGQGLVCVSDRCVSAGSVCQLGTVDCACSAAEACAPGLRCEGGLCVAGECSESSPGSSCEPSKTEVQVYGFSALRQECPEGSVVGDPDCECEESRDCDLIHFDPLVCRNHQCVFECGAGGSGFQGDEGCRCHFDDTCNEGGLECSPEGECTRPAGSEGGACYGNSTCDSGLKCLNGACTPCVEGTSACDCDTRNQCLPGLSCEAGTCVDPHPVAPIDTCFTPCTAFASEGATVRFCDDEGLMEGCLPGQFCQQGTCTREPDAPPPACALDSDCASHQACANGVCSSNCDRGSPCPDGLVCSKHVCRLTCNEAEPCPRGFGCNVSPSTGEGICEVVAPPDSGEVPVRPGHFEVDTNAINLSSAQRTVTFSVKNTSRVPMPVVVRKWSHNYRTQDGATAHAQLWPRCEAGALGCACRAGQRCSGASALCSGNVCVLDDCKPGSLHCGCNAGGSCAGGLLCRDGNVCLACEGADCPLHFLDMTADGTMSSSPEIHTTVPPGRSQNVSVEIPEASDVASQWRGLLEVSASGGDRHLVPIAYASEVTGVWEGEILSFGSFDEGGLQAWAAGANKTTNPTPNIVSNALVRRWARFRAGFEEVREFGYILNALRQETWLQPEVQASCEEQFPEDACYPRPIGTGLLPLTTTNRFDEPVPSGAAELPLKLHLMSDCASGSDCTRYVGFVDSTHVLQYPGYPGVRLDLSATPDQCRNVGGVCAVDVTHFALDVELGARQAVQPTERCPAGWRRFSVPSYMGALGPASERLEECREVALPYDTATGTATERAEKAALNFHLSGANPIADGLRRRRRLQALDGLLIDAGQLIMLVQETIEGTSTHPERRLYGIVRLGRQGELPYDAPPLYGSLPAEEPPKSPPLAPPQNNCDPELLAELGVAGKGWDSTVSAVLDGVVADTAPELVEPAYVHYLCRNTGRFNGGSGDHGGPGAFGLECPPESPVDFFLVREQGGRPALSRAEVAGLACQRDGSCDALLEAWAASGTYGVKLSPRWACEDEADSLCPGDALDRRLGKVFYRMPPGQEVTLPLELAVEEAFRFRTQFVGRTGTAIGYTPTECEGPVTSTSYCYDTEQIAEVQARVECLLAANFAPEQLNEHPGGWRDRAEAYLRQNFGTLDREGTRPGFEYMNAELLVMLGDEHYTLALNSRYDEAGANQAAFPGDEFEPPIGSQLSGVAGAEMRNLYTSVQYYQLALDRFHALSPALRAALARLRDRTQTSFIGATTIGYLDRLTKATTYKARSWSRIARVYHTFNRPELGRSLIRRAYTKALLESVYIVRFMQELQGDATTPEGRAALDDIARRIQDSQRTLRLALSEMRSAHHSVSDSQDFFGYAPNYIPFPASDHGRDNAVEAALFDAQRFVDEAISFEDEAIRQYRDFLVGVTEFDSELTQLEANYDGQLRELCGTVQVPGDPQLRPATRRYATLVPEFRGLGEICGDVGHGEIFEARGQVQVRLAELRRVIEEMKAVQEEAGVEDQRWRDACGVEEEFASLKFTLQGEANDIQGAIDELQTAVAQLDREAGIAATAAGQAQGVAQSCGALSFGCGGTVAAAAAWGVTTAVLTNTTESKEDDILSKQEDLRDKEAERIILDQEQACAAFEVDGAARAQTILLRIPSLEVEALAKEYELQLAGARVVALANKARSLQSELEAMLALNTDKAAARADPNVRIYRNAAMINADRAFELAIRHVYRATKVFEYFTAQSYGPIEELFVTRLAGRSQHNLKLYLSQLSAEYKGFEERFGTPNARVTRLSLKDDIMKVPLLGEGGIALSVKERTRRFRQSLLQSTRVASDGSIVVPFGIRPDIFSPVSRNHKIRYLEANIKGTTDDSEAFVGLRAAGAASVVPVMGSDIRTFILPTRLSRIFAMINGQKAVAASDDPAVYQARELVDRPVLNARWELVLDTNNEPANRDLSVGQLDDILLHLHYSDVTAQ